ncbi:MAG: hypothetical protein JWM62_3334 [Frankiales bacterium]|nr:hypothetical protein [Frankiales bacterium]
MPASTRLGLLTALLPLAGVLLTAPAGAQESPAPEPTCRAVSGLELPTITATETGGVSVRAEPGSVVDLFAYSRPSTTYALVRTGQVGDAGVAQFGVRPGGNTRLYAQQRGCTADPARDSVVLSVRPALTIKHSRTGTRSYSFYGTSVPARPAGLVISLYRVTADGQEVLTSRTRANATNGNWRISRTFSGSGRFGFVVRTAADISNAAGKSNVQSVLVY